MSSCTKLNDLNSLSSDNRSIVKFEENKMIYIGSNIQRKHVVMFKIDGNLQCGNSQKCDGAFILPDEKAVFFIELKGHCINTAADQIYSTINIFKQDLNSDCKIYGRIVSSRVPRPDLKSSHIVKLERTLASTQGNLKIQSQKLGEEI
jgi:hypothetical protein